MKKIIIIGLLLTGAAIITAQTMNTYCNAPPFVGGKNAVVIPNVLLTQDMTGSMAYYAYHPGSEVYNPAITYYGYADPASNYERVYRYRVLPDSYYCFRKLAGGAYSGNRINFAFMDRIDVSRKAFTGGKGRTYNNKDTLYFETVSNQNGFGSNRSRYYGLITTDSTERSKGVIRKIADKDSNFIWDAGAPHFALQVFANSTRFNREIRCPFGSTLISILNVLENQPYGSTANQPTGGTWCGDAIFEGVHYLRYTEPHWAADYTWNQSYVGTYRDPWYEVIGNDTVSVSCRPTFNVVIGDGGSNSDQDPPFGFANCNHLPHVNSPYGATHNNFWCYDFDEDYPPGGIDPYDDCNGPTYTHTRPGDDYAYYGHVNDLRPDLDPVYGIPDRQYITYYTIYLFAQGENNDADSILFRKIAKHGGFHDVPADTPGAAGYLKYDKTVEYDVDGNGRPDNFFYINNGSQLEAALSEIFLNIDALARITSASAGAITGTTSGLKSGGVTFLSQFYPTMPLNTYDLHWVGRTQALWLDPYGWVREDNDDPGAHTLHLKNDHVVSMFFSAGAARSMAARFLDTLGTGNDSFFVAVDTVPVESLAYIWDAAAQLRTVNYNSRTIYTNLNGSRADFVTTNAGLDPHLDFGSAARCDSLVNYVRGLDYSIYRSRAFGGTVWKLGDIVYSTPMPVSTPPEAYHMIYGDASYYDFWNHYLDRRNVVYVGANDGMIHAFNSGVSEQLTNQFTPLRLNPAGHTLGEELWGHIPFNVLPHLKWLMDTSYCHVNYNDLRVYPTDVKIFTPDADHVNGWGTILIGGMRFGGGEITVAGNTYRSAYTCYDVTNPEAGDYPKFMWEFKNDSLGYTLCLPVMIKITQTNTTRWFMLTGSGPQNLYGESARRACIFVVDPTNGSVVNKIILPAADSNTAITNIFAADWGLNYSVDLVYFGTYDKNGGGKIYRINTHEDINPTNWTLHQVINLGRPITAEGSVATDNRGNIWIYFGTGKYFSNVDVGDNAIQLFVGIKDDTTLGTATAPAFTLANLLDVTNVHIFADSVSGMAGVTTFDDLITAVELQKGWRRSLNTIVGERVVTPVLVFAGAVLFTTFAPNDTSGTASGPDLCIGGGGGPQAGNLWALFYLTGTAYKDEMLDTLPNGERASHVSIVGDMPSEPSWFLDKVFVQSAGGWKPYEFKPPYDPFGGVILWRGR